MAKQLVNSSDITINQVTGTNEINLTINSSSLLNKIYPVGSIYMSVNSTSPSTLFGGTWVAWGTGRVPVGVDTTQTEFNTVEKTGGSKELQEHDHGTGIQPDTAGGIYATEGNTSAKVYWNTAGIKTGTAGTGNSGNLQPYITCYMWKRTA